MNAVTVATPANTPLSAAALAPASPDDEADAAVVAEPSPEATDARESLTAPIAESARHVTIEVATTAEQLAALKPEYDRLQVACRNTLPFALHEWHVAWWEHLARTAGKVRDTLQIHVARDEHGQCVAIVPFVSTRREFLHLKTESLGLLGADPNLTELRCPLVMPGAEALVAKAITSRLAEGEWDWIQWAGVRGRLGEALEAAAPVAWQAPVQDYVIDLAPTWETFHRGLKRNIRESLRHCYNSLKRDGLTFDLEVAETPDAVRGALHTFLSLHTMRAALANTVAHAQRFDNERMRGFLYEVCDRLAERGVARVFVLKIRGCAVATRIAFVVGDQMYLYYSGFDPRWAKYSVSTTIVAEALKYAIGQGLTGVNLSTGTDVSKTRWGARLVSYPAAVQTRPRVRSRLTYAAYSLFREPQNDWLAPIKDRLPKRAWA